MGLTLYQAGATVIIAHRDKEKAKKAIAKMKNQKGSGFLEVGILDLASLRSVRHFAETFIEQHKQLHLLINIAGVATPPASKTIEGYESQFGVNFFGTLRTDRIFIPIT